MANRPMMTSRERVLAAFAHEEPDRVPRWCGASPEFMAKAKRQLRLADDEALLVRFGDDFRRVHARYAGPAGFSPDRDLSPGAIDVFFIGNDFGSRQGPLISPRAFDRFLMPHLRRLIRLGHDHGLKVQLHCCGGCEPLMPSMVAAGLDGLHAVQPCCRGMDLRQLKARYGDRILFNGAIDSQRVLIEGTPATVRQNVREVLSILAPGGGYVAGASHDYILEETPVENVLAMFDAIEEFGRYPIRPG